MAIFVSTKFDSSLTGNEALVKLSSIKPGGGKNTIQTEEFNGFKDTQTAFRKEEHKVDKLTNRIHTKNFITEVKNTLKVNKSYALDTISSKMIKYGTNRCTRL